MRTVHRRTGRFLSAWGALCVPTLAWSFSIDQAPGRLPKEIAPTSYAIAITPNVETHTLRGSESIVLEVRTPTDRIQFNSLNETLHGVRLDGRPVKRVVSDDKAQLTTVTLNSPASVGTHTLAFTYVGRIETEPHGLFAQPYKGSDGKPGLLLTTQMEATDARRMFPCWDEPAFRATFKLTATVPAAWTSVANMPVAKRRVHGKLATTTFADSPKMPSYLVEYTAGDLAGISAVSGGTRFGVWAIRGREQDGATALANAETILGDYNDYFGYRYPLPKLDSIAVPGGFQGAMENWGAITYNDQTLLLSASSSLKDRQLVFSIQAHEMAHQWNGDLVTMSWWDDIWLNESFASWMAAKETALRNPDWKWWEASDADKERAMSADARSASHAIQQHVTDELQASNAFDSEITYDKGQSILRMFEAFIGPDVFRAGIRNYMQAFAFSNATTVDLWNALSKSSGKDIAAIAAGWTEKPGFPLVNVAATCDAAGTRTLTLSQRRFLLRGAGEETTDWKVPLQIRAGADAEPRAVLLEHDNQTAPAGRCDEPLSIDAGALGFFRAHYDAATLTVDTENFARLPDTDRIALLDDQWALVQSGLEPMPTYLRLAASMGADLDTRAWSQIAAALGSIEYDLRGTPSHDAFAAYARSLLEPAFAALGWSERAGDTPDVQALRQSLIGALGNLGDPGVIAEARKRFAAFVGDHAAIAPDAQAAILTIVAQNADPATFEQLHAIAGAAKDETELRRYYSALMEVRDPTLARRAADIALSAEIPPQADAVRLILVIELAKDHQELSWSVFKENSERLMKPFVFGGPLLVAQYLPAVYWSGIPAEQIETWIRAHVPEEMSSSIDRGMETVRFRVAAKALLIRESDAFVAERKT
jgi:aminopeptidase N